MPPPGRNGDNVRQSDSLDRTRGTTATAGGQRPIAQLALIVAHPTPHAAVGAQRQVKVLASANGRYICQAGHRRGRKGTGSSGGAVSKLSKCIRVQSTPCPDTAVVPQRHVVIQSDRDAGYA